MVAETRGLLDWWLLGQEEEPQFSLLFTKEDIVNKMLVTIGSESLVTITTL